LKPLAILLVAIKVLSYWVEVSPFITGLLLQYLLISKVKAALCLGPKFQTLKGRAVVKGVSAHTLGRHIFDCFTGASPSHIDFFQTTQPARLSHNDDNHIATTRELFDVPAGSLAR